MTDKRGKIHQCVFLDGPILILDHLSAADLIHCAEAKHIGVHHGEEAGASNVLFAEVLTAGTEAYQFVPCWFCCWSFGIVIGEVQDDIPVVIEDVRGVCLAEIHPVHEGNNMSPYEQVNTP